MATPDRHALTVLLALGLASTAHATVPDKYGNGGRWLGAAGGGVAMIDDAFASRLNPAGLGRMRQANTSIGMSTAMEHFTELPPLWWDTNRDGRIDRNDPPLEYSADVDDATGLHLSLGRNIGGKFGLAGCMYLPINRLLRFSTYEPALPNWFMYTNRPQRYTLAVGVGGKIFPGVSIGASADMLSQARLTVDMTARVHVSGRDAGSADDATELIGEIEVDIHELHLDLVPAAVPVLGVQVEVGDWFEPLQGLVLAAAWRGSTGLLITGDVDLQADVSAEDLGELEPFVFSALLDMGLIMYDHFVPSTLTLGAAWRTDDTLSAWVDLRHTAWRYMTLNVTRLGHVDLTMPLADIDELVTDGNDFDLSLKNTWSARAGMELRLPRIGLDSDCRYLQITVRGGFGWEPSPLVGQGEDSAFLDTDRTMYTLGAGVEFWDPFELVDSPVRFDAFFQYHALAAGSLQRETIDPRAGYPVGTSSLPMGGHIIVAGAEWSFDY